MAGTKETSYSDYDVNYGGKPMSRADYHSSTFHSEDNGLDPVVKRKLEQMGGSADTISVKTGDRGDQK